MKKATMLAALLMMISAAGFANDKTTKGKIGENSKFKIVEKAQFKYDFIYVSDIPGEVCVSIYDTNGNKICFNTVDNAQSFKRTYDFGQLKAGKYKVVVRNEEGESNEYIYHKSKPAAKMLATFVSKLPDSRSLKVHVGASNTEKPVIIKIYDHNNKLMHSEEINSEGSFSKVYNLSKTAARRVSVLVMNGGEVKSFNYELN